MTQGQVLTVDTPQGIKNQYGVGYKIIVEPKVAMDEFEKLKASVIDP